jgi:hypothetical protein
VYCKYVLARPQVGNGGEDLQIWRLTANIWNNQSRATDKRRSFRLEFGRGANNFLPWKYNISFFTLWCFDPIPGYGLPLRGFTITLRHTTIGRTPLDEWSARRRDLYLYNTHHSQQRDIHVAGGIRTRDFGRRATADPCLRPRDHWDRLTFIEHEVIN